MMGIAHARGGVGPMPSAYPAGGSGGRVYRPGDRVLQLRNDYTLEVFNGDLGTVRAIDHTEQEMAVELDDGRLVPYPFASLYSLTHAYAVAAHSENTDERVEAVAKSMAELLQSILRDGDVIGVDHIL